MSGMPDHDTIRALDRHLRDCIRILRLREHELEEARVELEAAEVDVAEAEFQLLDYLVENKARKYLALSLPGLAEDFPIEEDRSQ